MDQRNIEPVINAEFKKDFYVHPVRVKTVAVSGNYRVFTLETNCGVSASFFNETPESKAMDTSLKESVVFVDSHVLKLCSPDHETLYYSVNLAGLVPDGWDLKVERLTGGRPISFGVVVYHPDHAEEIADVRPLTNTSFRENDEPQCVSVMQSSEWSVFPKGVRCEREENHIGNHQAIFKDYTYTWDFLDRPLSGDPYGEYGFKNKCPNCGFVTAGSASGARSCSTCSFWAEQKTAPGGFIINGKHYRPGRGGFGGAIFRIIRNDGTKWSGELFTQGDIPAWLKEDFPDNATFDVGESSFRDYLASN